MAKFQIKLLTPVYSSEGTRYLTTNMSSFSSTSSLEEENEFIAHFTYTYDEKLSIHQNGQKDLSFSMTQYQWIDDKYEENPFTKRIKVGSQILLIDAYNNEYLFTVKTINYNFKKDNILYSYSCQDSFTFELIRQQSGYSIENEEDSEDFIGAKDIDWWAKKIGDECFVSYEYIPLDTGIYEYKDNQSTILSKFKEGDSLNAVSKIVKQPFLKNEEKALFEPFPFSGSGNASSLLISLGETIGLCLNTRERLISNGNTIYVKKFFWFEPSKNNQPSGLKYSPNREVQDFKFDYKGDSLSTLLHITPNTINEEVVSIIPDIPPFFVQLIQNSEVWDNSSFYDGYFSSICKNQIFKSQTGYGDFTYYRSLADKTSSGSMNDFTYNTSYHDGTYTYIYLSDFQIPFFYDYFSFDGSSFRAAGEEDEITPKTRKWKLMIVEEQKEQYEEEGQTKERIVYIKHYYDTNDEILSKYKGNKECKVFIQIGLALPKNNASVMMYDNLVINCSRNFTQEELDFAEIADKCPWLENKLIDFSYFLNQKLLTTNEYAELMDNFINKLRKINGRLLMYSQSYYSALKLKVDQIAQLQNRVDAVCASYQSDVVDSFKNTGGVLSLDLFNKNYAAMEVGISESNKISVVGLDKTLVSYANKYLKAQQRFLKNMYEFRKYFESPCGWADAKLYKDTIVLDPPERKENEKERFYLSFSPSSWSLVDSGFNLYDEESFEPTVSLYNLKTKTPVEVVTKKNYNTYFKPNIQPGDLVFQDHQASFVGGSSYYKHVFRFPLSTWATFEKNNTIDYYADIFKYDTEDAKNSYTTKTGGTGTFLSVTSKEYRVFGGCHYTLVCLLDQAVKTDSNFIGLYFLDSSRNIIKDDSNNVISVTYTKADPPNRFWGIDAPKEAKYLVIQVPQENADKDACGIKADFVKIKEEDGYVYAWPIGWPNSINTVVNNSPDYSAYIPVGLQEIFNECLYRKIRKDYATNKKKTDCTWKYRDYIVRQYINPANDVYKTGDSSYFYQSKPDWFKALLPYTWFSCFKEGETSNSEWSLLIQNIKAADTTTIGTLQDIYWKFYKTHFPITKLYLDEPNYSNVKLSDGFNLGSYQAINKKYKTIEDYAKYWKEQLLDKVILKVENPFDESQQQTFTVPLANPYNVTSFHRRVVAAPAWGYVAAAGAVVAGTLLGSFIGMPGTGALVGAAFANIISTAVWNTSTTTWSTDGINTEYFDGSDIEINAASGETYPRGYIDTNVINFASSASAYEEYIAINKEIQEKGYVTGIYQGPKTKDSDVQLAARTNNTSTEYLYGEVSKTSATDSSEGYTKYKYFNYFSQHIPTYKALTENNIYKNSNLYFEDQYLVPIPLTQRVSKERTYKMIILTKPIDGTNTSVVFVNYPTVLDFLKNRQKTIEGISRPYISKNIDYPIYNASTEVDFSVLGDFMDDSPTLEEALKKAWGCSAITKPQIEGVDVDSEYFFQTTVTNPNDGKNYLLDFVFCEERNFFVKSFDIKFNLKLYSGQPVYDEENAVEVQFIKQPSLVEGFFLLAENASDYALASGDFNENDAYYKQTDEGFSRVYTLAQIKNNENIYYKDYADHVEENLQATKDTFSAPVWGHYEKYDEKDKIINHKVVSINIPVDFKYPTDKNSYLGLTDSEKPRTLISVEYDGNIYYGNYWFKGEQLQSIGNINKGTFWYRYHNMSSQPALMTEATVIETQLTSYWQVAHAASLYCEYFLPENWQPAAAGADNIFSQWVVAEDQNKNALLLSKLVPFVNVTSRNTQLYDFISEDEENEKENIEIPSYSIYDYALQTLGEKRQPYLLSPTHKGCEYRANGGGVMWKNLLSMIKGSSDKYEYFDGQYIMMYKQLLAHFVELRFDSYFNLLDQKNAFWKKLYKQYPNLLLEDSFSNKDATTSKELLSLAEYYFKDKTKPEENYQITYINADLLEGYDKSELKIGDGIQIDVQSYYNEYDDLYRSLSQYLFITDISYTLRKDSDVALTVNSIKYQDKLIQRLVKLIK